MSQFLKNIILNYNLEEEARVMPERPIEILKTHSENDNTSSNIDNHIIEEAKEGKSSDGSEKSEENK